MKKILFPNKTINKNWLNDIILSSEFTNYDIVQMGVVGMIWNSWLWWLFDNFKNKFSLW